MNDMDVVRAARTAPYLSQTQETELARSWRDRGDRRARETLYRSHLRQVISQAVRRRSYATRFLDMVAEGSVGLLQAIDRFDPEAGNRLSTYAKFWISAQINEFVRTSTGVVPLPASADFKKASSRFVRVLEEAERNGSLHGHGDPVTAAARTIGVPEHVVTHLVARNQGNVSLDANRADHAGGSIMERLPCTRRSQHACIEERQKDEWTRDVVLRCIGTLTDREREVYLSRELTDEPRSLEDLSKAYGLSKQRVSQIQVKARTKVAAAAMREREAATIHLRTTH